MKKKQQERQWDILLLSVYLNKQTNTNNIQK